MSNKILRREIFAITISAALLAACAHPHQTRPITSIEGTVDIVERVELPQQAVLVVQLKDAAQPESAQVISQQTIKIENLKPPFNFTLPLDREHQKVNKKYILKADITHGGENLFTSNSIYTFIEDNEGNKPNIILMPVIK